MLTCLPKRIDRPLILEGRGGGKGKTFIRIYKNIIKNSPRKREKKEKKRASKSTRINYTVGKQS